jgi:hypothetical protein
MALPYLTIPDLFTPLFLNLKKKKLSTSPCKMPFQACVRQLEWRVSSIENLHKYTYNLNRDTLQLYRPLSFRWARVNFSFLKTIASTGT